MTSFAQQLTAHHKRCDDVYARAELAAAKGRWEEATTELGAFVHLIEAHLGIEEQQLFPAFENATGLTQGPTTFMRMEHEQMRRLFDELRGAVERKDADGFAGAGETLVILMQQHNLKEENMLYPLCDRALEGEAALLEAVAAALKAAG